MKFLYVDPNSWNVKVDWQVFLWEWSKWEWSEDCKIEFKDLTE